MCQAIEEIMEEGRIEGRREGRAEGRKEGRAEGRREGRREGRKEGRASVLVKNIENAMQNFHVSLQVACENLGTTVEEYQKAKETLTIR